MDLSSGSGAGVSGKLLAEEQRVWNSSMFRVSTEVSSRLHIS